jgi:hypothetical protein
MRARAHTHKHTHTHTSLREKFSEEAERQPLQEEGELTESASPAQCSGVCAALQEEGIPES